MNRLTLYYYPASSASGHQWIHAGSQSPGVRVGEVRRAEAGGWEARRITATAWVPGFTSESRAADWLVDREEGGKTP